LPLRLYVDECVDARIITGLRRRGIPVTTAADQDLLGAEDEVHLEQAKFLGMVLVTNDYDFLRLLREQTD
jgi:predicted nuclease of predicted toxin-antitoxin system